MLKYIKSILALLKCFLMSDSLKLFIDVRFDVVPIGNCAIPEAVFKQYIVCAW